MSGFLEGLLPRAREMRVEVSKYDVLASGDPACSHDGAQEDPATGQRACSCGRLETLAERQITAYALEGGATPC